MKSKFDFQVVFQNGEGALQVLPPLVDVIPEARLNLVIYYLKEGRFSREIVNENKIFLCLLLKTILNMRSI